VISVVALVSIFVVSVLMRDLSSLAVYIAARIAIIARPKPPP
jgi:hypothetical protein